MNPSTVLCADDAAGRLVGCVYFGYRVGGEQRRARAYGIVAPEHRGRGLGGELLRWAIEQAWQLGATSMDIVGPSAVGERLLRGYRFVEERAILHMEHDDTAPADSRWPHGYFWKALPQPPSERQVKLWHALHHRAFAHAWGFVPFTVQYERSLLFAPEAVVGSHLLAMTDDDDEPIGLCRAVLAVGRQQTTGEAVGHIGPVGVVAAHQGRGIGRALLRQSLVHLHHIGITRAELRVDEQNTPAVYLYQSSGFTTRQRLGLWRRELGGSDEG